MRARTVALAVAAACAASCLASYLRGARLRGAPVVPLESALARAKTGDLVAFRGYRAPWDVPGQAGLLLSAVTHVGMVVRDGGVVTVVETHNAGDTARLGVFDGGVHTYPLDQRARAYDGEVYLCRLAVPLGAGQELALRAALRELSGVPFETAYRSRYARKCLVRPPGPRAAEPRGKMFCSEYVGLALVRAGLLPPDTDTQCLTPGSFLDLRVGGGHPLYTDLVRLAV